MAQGPRKVLELLWRARRGKRGAKPPVDTREGRPDVQVEEGRPILHRNPVYRDAARPFTEVRVERPDVADEAAASHKPLLDKARAGADGCADRPGDDRRGDLEGKWSHFVCATRALRIAPSLGNDDVERRVQ